MRFTLKSVVDHFQEYWGSLAVLYVVHSFIIFYKQDKRIHAARLTLVCSAVFSSEAVWFYVGWSSLVDLSVAKNQVSQKCFRVSQNSVDYINTCSAFGLRMSFTFETDIVHLHMRKKCPTKQINISKKLASILDVVHSLSHCGPLAWWTSVKN